MVYRVILILYKTESWVSLVFIFTLAFLMVLFGVIYLFDSNCKNDKKKRVEPEHVQPSTIKEVMDMHEQEQLSISQWFGTFLLLGVPIVKIVFSLIWALGEDNPRKKFSLAALLYMLVAIILLTFALVLTLFV
jgi:uncharacterized iron-regulated membrane protein